MSPTDIVLVQIGQVDLARRRIVRADGGPSVALSPRETQLLGYLVANAPRVVSSDELLVEVWGYAPGVRSRTVESTIHTLRRKLEHTPKQPDHLLTVHGEGYRWVALPAPTHTALQAVRHAADLPRTARDLVARAVVEALALDDPAAGLNILDELGPDGSATERATLLLVLGRIDEATQVLDPSDPHAFERARLAYRRNMLDEYESLLARALERSSGVPRGKVLLRMGVWCLDRGRVDEGYARLDDAVRQGVDSEEPIIESAGWGEIGMYRTMQGHLDTAEHAIRQCLATGAPLRSAYLEQLGRLSLTLILRVQGRDTEADVQRAKVESLAPRRLLEPGAFKFQALERRLANDVDAARSLLDAGIARHAERPNLPDGAGLQAIRASWHGHPYDVTDASAFTAALVDAAHGVAPAPDLSVELHEPLVRSVGPWPDAGVGSTGAPP